MNEYQTLEQIVGRLSNLPPFTVHKFDDTTNEIAPFMNVTQGIVQELVINEVNLQEQVQAISAQIQYWARLVSIARRTVVVLQRNYRQWQAYKYIQAVTPPQDEKESKAFKKPTEEGIKALYRVDPEYIIHQTKIENAEETLSSCEGILEGFRAKLQSMKLSIQRNRDDGMPRLSV